MSSDFDEVYNKNYLRLMNKDIDYLMNLFFNSKNSFLKEIAKDIILKENRIEECYDSDIISKFMSFLSIEELWYYRGSDNPILKKIATETLIHDITEADAMFRRDLIHIVK